MSYSLGESLPMAPPPEHARVDCLGVALRLVKHDILCLVRVVSRDDGVRRFAVAQVDRLMKQVGRNEKKVARLLITESRRSGPYRVSTRP